MAQVVYDILKDGGGYFQIYIFSRKKKQNHLGMWEKFSRWVLKLFLHDFLCKRKMRIHSIFSNFQREIFSRFLKIFTWFFVQKKAENSYFTNQKFFTPSLVFYPLIWDLHIPHDKLFSSMYSKLQYFNAKKVG